MSEGSNIPISRLGDIDLVEPRPLSAAIHLFPDEVRHLLQQGIDSGPGMDANTAFARIRARLASLPDA